MTSRPFKSFQMANESREHIRQMDHLYKCGGLPWHNGLANQWNSFAIEHFRTLSCTWGDLFIGCQYKHSSGACLTRPMSGKMLLQWMWRKKTSWNVPIDFDYNPSWEDGLVSDGRHCSINTPWRSSQKNRKQKAELRAFLDIPEMGFEAMKFGRCIWGTGVAKLEYCSPRLIKSVPFLHLK